MMYFNTILCFFDDVFQYECATHLPDPRLVVSAQDVDLCVPCYQKLTHPHPMTKLGLDLDDGHAAHPAASGAHPSGPGAAASGPATAGPDGSESKTPAEVRRVSIQTYVVALVHACQCRDANCRLPSCRRMKRVTAHGAQCQSRRKANAPATACPTCKQLLALCLAHAKTCAESRCPVPFCPSIREKLEKQRIEQQFKDAQLMRRRMAQMHKMRSVAAAEQEREGGGGGECGGGWRRRPGGRVSGTGWRRRRGGTAGRVRGGGKQMHAGVKSPLTGALLAARMVEQAAQRQAGYMGGPPQHHQHMMQQQMMAGGGMGGGGGRGAGGTDDGPGLGGDVRGGPHGWHDARRRRDGRHDGGAGGGEHCNSMGGGMPMGSGPGGQMLPQEEMLYRQHVMAQMGAAGGGGGSMGGGGMHMDMTGGGGHQGAGGGGPPGGGGAQNQIALQKLLATLRSPTSQDQGTSPEVLGMLKSSPRLMASVINKQVGH